jgi:hypothetical protein
MNGIHGTIRNGQVILDSPSEWAEGTSVIVTRDVPSHADELPDDDNASPEAIAWRLALIDRIQPWMSPAEFTEWERHRAEEKAFQLSQWGKWTKTVGEAAE